jgi:hypothetical protein
MIRRTPPFAAVLLCSLTLAVPSAFGQALSYPDKPDYEAFRRTELETLDSLSQEDPSRALSFRLLMSQRRLREAQLMIVKEKFELVPPALEAYGEAVQGVMEALQTLPEETLIDQGVYQSVEAAGQRQQKIIQNLARPAREGLSQAVEAALAASQQLRLFAEGRIRAPEARPPSEGLGVRRSVTIEEPVTPEEALAKEEGIEPLSPEATPKVKILPPAAPPPRRPEESFGRRLRPFEPETRGLRRPGTTHPRPRARERERRRD